MTDQTAVETDAIHAHFGLSYANYLVLPRTLLQSMPDRWQTQFVTLLDEMTEAFRDVPQAEAYKVEAATEHIVWEMTEAEQAQAGIEADWYGEEVPGDLDPDALLEWKVDHQLDAPTYYDRDGNELDAHQRVLLPVSDPVPHYQRGRAYIAPGTSGRTA
ncbi:hypothetical protein OH540_09560 [Streptomyces sp. BPPL-273]|uniref:hypothetical protein n=1 Tax=Streptomyces sp. BPPL-273 TaxID=2987533 RepID=UPI0024AFF579|nr:hypothetical protein [Streptomyces sp. BPPL-273]WHM30269.1 hypothetical protein OH540_09560 [Streptomyces sp. BPPL-273]